MTTSLAGRTASLTRPIPPPALPQPHEAEPVHWVVDRCTTAPIASVDCHPSELLCAYGATDGSLWLHEYARNLSTVGRSSVLSTGPGVGAGAAEG